VYSEEGKGTTFKLLLPAVASSVPDEAAAQPQPMSRGTGNLLIVDDEEAVRGVVARMCSNMGFEVFTATDGVHALDVYKEKANRIDAVLLDLTMPHMDGEETFREVRRMNPDAFVLLMSGFNEQEAMGRFVGKGLAGFIQKPFTPEQLREKLRTFFSSAAS
jgi:CheY-like chemotaxis protein